MGKADELARLVDALNDEPVLIVAAERLPDIRNRAGRRLIDLRHQADVGAVNMRERFAQGPARQEIAVAEDVHGVHKQDVHVAFKLPVLVAVIENGHLRAEMLNRIAPCDRTLRSDEDGNVRQMLCQHKCLVARRLGIHLQRTSVRDNADIAAPLRTVAAVEDRNAVAHLVNRTREMLCRRRLARTADRNVAEADDEAVQLLLFNPAPAIHGQLEIDELFIDE